MLGQNPVAGNRPDALFCPYRRFRFEHGYYSHIVLVGSDAAFFCVSPCRFSRLLTGRDRLEQRAGILGIQGAQALSVAKSSEQRLASPADRLLHPGETGTKPARSLRTGFATRFNSTAHV